MIDLDELERLARAATPGPWTYEEFRNDKKEVLGAVIKELGWSVDRENGSYVAAANPAVVLELIAERKSVSAELSVRTNQLVKAQNAAIEMTGKLRIATEALKNPENHWHMLNDIPLGGKCTACTALAALKGEKE